MKMSEYSILFKLYKPQPYRGDTDSMAKYSILFKLYKPQLCTEHVS